MFAVLGLLFLIALSDDKWTTTKRRNKFNLTQTWLRFEINLRYDTTSKSKVSGQKSNKVCYLTKLWGL